MINPIEVTRQEWYQIGFLLFCMGGLYTIKNMFLPPHERDQETDFEDDDEF